MPPRIPFGSSPVVNGVTDERSERNGEIRGFQSSRSGAGRLGPQGNRDRRDRDARPDGDPRGVRARAAAASGARIAGSAAHDDPDRRADRDAAGARAPRCAGRRATSSRRRTTPPPRSPRAARRCSRTRASRSTSTGSTRTASSSGRTAAAPEHDPRRRRRRDAARAPRRAGREGPRPCIAQPDERGRDRAVRRDQAKRLDDDPKWYSTRSSARSSGVTEETTTGVKRLYQMHARRAARVSRRSTSTTR